MVSTSLVSMGIYIPFILLVSRLLNLEHENIWRCIFFALSVQNFTKGEKSSFLEQILAGKKCFQYESKIPLILSKKCSIVTTLLIFTSTIFSRYFKRMVRTISNQNRWNFKLHEIYTCKLTFHNGHGFNIFIVGENNIGVPK